MVCPSKNGTLGHPPLFPTMPFSHPMPPTAAPPAGCSGRRQCAVRVPHRDTTDGRLHDDDFSALCNFTTPSRGHADTERLSVVKNGLPEALAEAHCGCPGATQELATVHRRRAQETGGEAPWD